MFAAEINNQLQKLYTMKKILIVLATLFTLNASAQEMGNYAKSAGNFMLDAGNASLGNRPVINPPGGTPIQASYQPGQTTMLPAEILLNLEADSYLAIFSATQYGPSASSTDSLMEIRTNYVKGELKKLGIDDRDIHVDVISFVPAFANKVEVKKLSRSYNEVPVGFQMKKNIHVVFRNHTLVDRIISIMAAAEIYDLVKVDYNSSKLKEAYQMLRDSAIKILEEKKDGLVKLGFHAENMGFTEGHDIYYPADRYSSYQAYYYVNTISVDQDRMANLRSNPDNFKVPTGGDAQNNYFGNITVNNGGNSVAPKPKAETPPTTTYTERQVKETTYYFNRLAPERYDQIIGGNISGPTIQISYKLNLSCSLETLENYNRRKKAEEDAINLKNLSKKERRKLKKQAAQAGR